MFIVYSAEDPVSLNAGMALIDSAGPEEAEPLHGMRHFRLEGADILELEGHHLHSELLDEIVKTDCIIFLSRHSSAKGTPAFTVHPEGNWNGEARVGGQPRQLSTAAPVEMLRVLRTMANGLKSAEIEVTYEATHHGPLLKTPSLYAEVGGNEEVWANKTLAAKLADFVLGSVGADVEFDNVALGVGGMHYPTKFTKLALDGRYAFAHMMPRHHAGEIEMIGQAIERSSPRPEVAVIEWKSLRATERNAIIGKLDEVGLDHVRV